MSRQESISLKKYLENFEPLTPDEKIEGISDAHLRAQQILLAEMVRASLGEHLALNQEQIDTLGALILHEATSCVQLLPDKRESFLSKTATLLVTVANNSRSDITDCLHAKGNKGKNPEDSRGKGQRLSEKGAIEQYGSMRIEDFLNMINDFTKRMRSRCIRIFSGSSISSVADLCRLSALEIIRLQPEAHTQRLGKKTMMQLDTTLQSLCLSFQLIPEDAQLTSREKLILRGSRYFN